MTEFVNRGDEKQKLGALLDAVREGDGGALVLRGEPGVGKTALLDHAIASAPSFRVARVVGVEAETALPYAGVHQLLVPFLPAVERLPRPQREALRLALGLAAGVPPDRFFVGLAVLTLLAEQAHEQPLLCVVDDSQWVDVESAEVLAFVARRLHADPIAVLIAVREPAARRLALHGLPQLRLSGLAGPHARRLLSSLVAGELDERVADEIVAATRGNPLALIELAGELTAAELAGTSVLPDPLPLSSRLEDSFLSRLSTLSTEQRQLLLLAAAEPDGEPGLLWRAARRLGLAASAAASLEIDQLLAFRPRVCFRHPLMRSAVYGSASPDERWEVHEAFAAASDPALEHDRSAWHRAAVAVGTDDELADDLEQSAPQARRRGGYAGEADFLLRAAELSPDERRRSARLLAAAEAQLLAGAPANARALLERAAVASEDQPERARLRRLRGMLRVAQGQPADAPAIMLRAARALGPVDQRLAQDTLLQAVHAGHLAGHLASADGAPALAGAAGGPRGSGRETTAADLLLEGFATRLTTGYRAGVAPLRGAIAVLRAQLTRGDETVRWVDLGCIAAGELLDDEASHTLASRWVQLARDRGAKGELLHALPHAGTVELLSGRFGAAEERYAEAAATAATTRMPSPLGATAGGLLALAWRGNEAAARPAAAETASEATEHGRGVGVVFAQHALTVLELGLGNYDAALSAARTVVDDDPLYWGGQTLAELIEAAVRSGERDEAAAALRQLAERANATGTAWALGLLARSQALLAADADAEALYVDAIARLKRSRVTPQLGRAYLLYGEWLRRRRRRRDAREQLRVAHQMLESMGAAAFAERARVELLATGERARKRSAETRDELTPQEAQIARLAADGASNPEIAAQLFISASTVEYHLRKVFRKLDLNSRTQLARALPEQESPFERAGEHSLTA
jgi:DNA-binding CsgD family transcriptional regulator